MALMPKWPPWPMTRAWTPSASSSTWPRATTQRSLASAQPCSQMVASLARRTWMKDSAMVSICSADRCWKRGTFLASSILRAWSTNSSVRVLIPTSSSAVDRRCCVRLAILAPVSPDRKLRPPRSERDILLLDMLRPDTLLLLWLRLFLNPAEFLNMSVSRSWPCLRITSVIPVASTQTTSPSMRMAKSMPSSSMSSLGL
mmetsp:Transcript_93237/g.263915  ORF Transcript_93237/g.263915 Transcript_93237/m.263915 type:complete len:200 (-) Transcript_93237:560-1159(-)